MENEANNGITYHRLISDETEEFISKLKSNAVSDDVIANRKKIMIEIASFISDRFIYEFVVNEIVHLPDYFWTVPASSTGKYHPAYSLGDGGLFRHTKSACIIALDLFKADIMMLTAYERDIVLAALILHDGYKQGDGDGTGGTVFEHPHLMGEHIVAQIKGWMTDEQRTALYDIQRAVRSHMGKWNTREGSNITLPLPGGGIGTMVHLCDYIASRRYLEMNFSLT